jgi:hypothetical protein
MTKLVRVTAWSNPNEILESQYGEVPYAIWIELERVRLIAQGRARVDVVYDKRGRIALFASKVKRHASETQTQNSRRRTDRSCRICGKRLESRNSTGQCHCHSVESDKRSESMPWLRYYQFSDPLTMWEEEPLE